MIRNVSIKGPTAKLFLVGLRERRLPDFVRYLSLIEAFSSGAANPNTSSSLLNFSRKLCYNLLIYILLFFEYEM